MIAFGLTVFKFCKLLTLNWFYFLLCGCLFTEMHDRFSQFDKDGDGQITREEFIGVMTSLGYNVNVDQVDSMLNAVDTDSKSRQSSQLKKSMPSLFNFS